MKKQVTTAVGILAFIIFILISLFIYNYLSKKIDSPNALNQEINNEESTNETIKAPEFTVVNNSDDAIQFSELVGKPIVLNFWATWCGFCIEEMPIFDEVYKELGDEVTFMMIDITDGQRETIDKGRAYINENGFTFPVYFDEYQEVANIYQVRSLPSTYFINSEGNIVAGIEGAITKEILLEGISLAMEQ